uniref:Secreted protein n=1 Tax=Spongospora subterranea TaxID=70186 RepID=A0A0H5QUG9_9EUKA|eukprot:CRZ05654.1 hypothetical protein [Spongospora subterranea]
MTCISWVSLFMVACCGASFGFRRRLLIFLEKEAATTKAPTAATTPTITMSGTLVMSCDSVLVAPEQVNLYPRTRNQNQSNGCAAVQAETDISPVEVSEERPDASVYD